MAHGGGYAGRRVPNPNQPLLIPPQQYIAARGRGCMGFTTPQAVPNVRQNLESSLAAQLNESLFNPGSTGTSGGADTRRQTVTFGTVEIPEKGNFEKHRRGDIKRLNDEFQRVNIDLTNIVRARNEAQDEADTITRELKEENEQLEETARRLKANLGKQEREFHESCKAIRRQTEELLRERDEQIEENEQTRTEMLEENETINEKQKRMAYEVAELEMRRRTLVEQVEQAATNVSRIARDPYEGMPRLEDDSSQGHNQTYPSSTPSNNRTNPFLEGYNPYVNEGASKHVRDDVYEAQSDEFRGGGEERTRRNTIINAGNSGSTHVVHQGAPGAGSDDSDLNDSGEHEIGVSSGT